MSRVSSTSIDILAPGDAAHLMSMGLAGPSNNGMRKVHKRRLNRSSDEENSHIPLSTNPRSRPDAFATIPDKLLSKETIVYLGFNRDKATEIWNGWNNWPASPPRREIDPDDGGLEVTFLDWVKGRVSYSNDVWEDDTAAWLNCMQSWGIATELQHAIMDQHFKSIRLTGTCAGWVRDTIKMRYAGLEDIQRASKERERANPPIIAASSASGSGSRQGLSATSSGRSFSGMQRDALPGIPIDSCSSTQAIASQNAPGMTVLYKGMDQARTHGLFDSQGNLNDISVLDSPPRTDFSKNRSLYYFTPNFDVAKRYAGWAKRRDGVQSVVVIRMAIRNSVIESMPQGKLQRVFWPSSEWKELIWRCRTKRPPSKELTKYGAAILIIGTIANKPDKYYYNYSSPEQLTEDCVLMTDGPAGQRPAIQFVFSSEPEGEALLTDEARSTIELFYFSTAELEKLMDEHENN
ncbi:hypothetical protein BKA59DRAFT_535316 [Fusarium tricinctum]|uniref:Uncharacterized protein n=1 Tax=Fusarium tricinctum TaxID=61284 RepID=A0A8K0W6K3_9HYPO|nr:hypothetical protein BKA59DRAFT_535316 [Fusarium tricinctum]